MPRLDQLRPQLFAALVKNPGPPSNARAGPLGIGGTPEVDPFRRITQAALYLVAEPRLASVLFALLDDAGLLEPVALATIDSAELESILAQSRVKFGVKSLRPLIGLAQWAVSTRFDADRAAMASTDFLRESWREIRGLGPTSVDSILLLGLDRPAYPIDQATYRVFVRHGWLDPSADYDEARSLAESLAPEEPATLRDLSEALARVGQNFCKATIARCELCNLRHLLPEGGPRDVE